MAWELLIYFPLVGFAACSFLLIVAMVFDSINKRTSPLTLYIQHLRGCVVEGICPAADSQAHVLLERILWWPIQRLGRFGAAISLAAAIVSFGPLTMVDLLAKAIGRRAIFFP